MVKAGGVQARLRERSESAGTVGTTLMGGRKEFVAKARALVELAGAQVRESLAAPEVVQEYCETVRAGIQRGVMDRTCLRLYSEIMKLVGEERTLVVQFVQSLGVADEGELRSIVERVRGAEGADVVTAIERCCAFLEGALPMHEEHRGMVIKRLGGYLPTDLGASDGVRSEVDAVERWGEVPGA